jgi:hypothetical protein
VPIETSDFPFQVTNRPIYWFARWSIYS